VGAYLEPRHDQLWWESLNPDPRVWIAQRRRADALFRISLRETHTSAVRASLMWSFVVIERYWGARRMQAIAMAAQIVVGIGLIYLSALGLFGWWGLALAAAPALAALVWAQCSRRSR
jgi:hypothetical protein